MRISELPRATLLAIAMGTALAATANAHAAGVVVSQVYGGGGNSLSLIHI